MDLKQLTYFITIAEEKSYLRAAKRLNISQPALSAAIKKLEQEVGKPLFCSFGRERELTDEGTSLFLHAKELLELYQRTLDDIRRPQKQLRGKIRFGLPPLMGACFFGDILSGFSKECPGIQISIVEEGAKCVDQLIEKGDLDIALSLHTRRNSLFEQRHFTLQRNMVLVHKDHWLAARESLTIADLRKERFAIFNENFVLHDRIMDACYNAGFSPEIVLLTNQWDFMVKFVEINQGITILPKPVCDNSVKGNIVAIPLTDSMKDWDIIVIWNKQRYFNKVCETFCRYMIEHSPADDPSVQMP